MNENKVIKSVSKAFDKVFDKHFISHLNILGMIEVKNKHRILCYWKTEVYHGKLFIDSRPFQDLIFYSENLFVNFEEPLPDNIADSLCQNKLIFTTLVHIINSHRK